MPNTNLVDYYQLGLAAATLANADLTVNEGDVVDMLLAAGAAMADRTDQENSQGFKKTFVDGAESDDLTTLSDDHYDIDRQDATSSTATVEFSRPSAGGSEPGGTISAGFEVATPVDAVGEDVRFVTDADVVFALAELGPKSIGVTSIVAGPDNNVETVGGISRMIDVPFDLSMAVVSTTVAAGGNLEETDPEVRLRIRDRPATLARATKAALKQGALTVSEVRVASVVEDTVTGIVTVNVSDTDGNSNAQMINDVIIALEDWRAYGIPVTVTGGVRILTDMTLQLKLADGAALAGLTTPVIDSVTGEINKLVQGGVLYDTLYIAAAKNVAPDLIDDVTITALTVNAVAQTIGDVQGSGTNDYTPASNELIRAGSITVVAA